MFRETETFLSARSFFVRSVRGKIEGGWKKRGGWKTSRMTPLPKRGFGPPPPLVQYVFRPPQVSVLCFSCTKKSTTEQTRSSFGGVQDFPGERVLWHVLLPPYVLHPPYHGPSLLHKPSCPLPLLQDFAKFVGNTLLTTYWGWPSYRAILKTVVWGQRSCTLRREGSVLASVM